MKIYRCRCGRKPCTLAVQAVDFRRRVRRPGFSMLRFVHVAPPAGMLAGLFDR